MALLKLVFNTPGAAAQSGSVCSTDVAYLAEVQQAQVQMQGM